MATDTRKKAAGKSKSGQKTETKPSQKNHVLVMWSGGLDSNYRLAWLLKETDYMIHAHHMIVQNHENRAAAELQMIEKLLPQYRDIRPFTYSQNIVDCNHLHYIPEDIVLMVYHAALLANSHARHSQLRPFTHWTTGTNADEGHDWSRWNYLQGIFSGAVFDRTTVPIKQPKFDLFHMVGKKSQCEYMKKIGLPEHWGCRKPVAQKNGAYTICGQCRTCVEYKEIGC